MGEKTVTSADCSVLCKDPIILVEWGRPPPSRGKFHKNNYFFLDPFPNNSYSISCEQSHETDTDDRKQLTMLLHVENTISYLGWNY